MKLPRHLASAALVFVLISGSHDSLRAQVVETRESESNPVVTIFRGTLYGVGTGLLLGGAYALIESDSRDETWDILKWGTAGGAIAGAAVGLVWVLARPQPEGDADVVGMVDASSRGVDFGMPTIVARRVDDRRPPSRQGSCRHGSEARQSTRETADVHRTEMEIWS